MPHSLSTDSKPLRLYTFTLSHFSEKARWALTASQVPYVEEGWTPYYHVVPAILSGGKTTVPILQVGGKRIQDSTRIVLWLDEQQPLSILPSEEALRAETLAIEDRFDRVGEHVVRYAYNHTLDDAESVIRYWTLDSTPSQAAVVRKLFPLFRWIFRRKLFMSARGVKRSREVVETGLAFIEEKLARGQRYLAGDRFSLADITAAALLAPLVCPDEHPVYGSERYRKGIAADVAAWQGRPAFEWVRGMYREHRGELPDTPRVRRALELA